MSTRAQHMAGQNPWDHPQFVLKHPIQLEEHIPYPLEPTSSSERSPHHHQFPPSSLNTPVAPSRYGPYASAVPFEPSAPLISQSSMRTSSFNSLDPNHHLALDTSSSSFGASSHSARISPVYNQPSLNALEPNQTKYQANQFAPGLEPNHSPEVSPTPRPIVSNHPSSHSYAPAGPIQFPGALPLPSRQSELQSRYFNTLYMTPQSDSLKTQKRPRPNDVYDDTQGDQHDAQEQEAARPNRSVESPWHSLQYQLMSFQPQLGSMRSVQKFKGRL